MLSQKVMTIMANDENNKMTSSAVTNKYRPPSGAKERLLAKMAKTKGFGIKARMVGK